MNVVAQKPVFSPALVTKYVTIARTNARQQLTYRGEFVTRALSMVLFMGVFIALWTTAFGVSEQGTLAGYTLPAMCWYLAVTETITLSGSRVFVEIGEAVRSGDVAYTLVRPLSYPAFMVAHSLGESAPRFVMNLLVAAAVVLVFVRTVATTPAGFVGFLVLAAGALVLDALMMVLIGLLAFLIEEVTPVFWIYQKLLFTVGGLFLPLEFFPDWLQGVVRVLPFQFISYAPARAFVAFDPAEFAGALAGQIIYIVVIGLLVLAVWRYGQRRLAVHGG
ncbi:MAG: ABC-2 family transporter protein [Chloroflexi bacterium]|nr:ABC-2 family transporter protein [Chloroflexota bacterium]MBU1748767.1 ABC-2 family transporter protein [Chloroflexota bacterium]